MNALWRRFDDYDSLDEQARDQLIDSLCERSGLGARRDGDGYDYIVMNDKAFIESYVLGSVLRTIEVGVNRNKRSDVVDEKTRVEAIRQEIRDNEGVIMAEYKIHLQPTRDQLGPVVRRLVETLLDDRNTGLRESLMGFKIRQPYGAVDKEADRLLPEIVIYPRVGEGQTDEDVAQARANAEKVLAAVTAGTSDLVNLGRTDKTPRFNTRVNDLVYVAQSSGDFKEFLRDEKLLDEYFDAETGYAYRRGERPLDRPAAADDIARNDVKPDWTALRSTEKRAREALAELENNDHDPKVTLAVIKRLHRTITEAKAEASRFYDRFDKLDRRSLDLAVTERKGLTAALERLQDLASRLETGLAEDQRQDIRRPPAGPAVAAPPERRTPPEKTGTWDRVRSWIKKIF